ncbi:CRE-SCD-1 protein [Aphelenchoides avenae]|nr:CRE-SCD-1 protein [Aphelenchus avenae]
MDQPAAAGATGFESVIQNAIQAGVPPQQVIQFLQHNLQALHQANPAAAQQPQQPPAGGLSGFQQQLAAIAAAAQQQQHQAAAAAAAQQQQQHAAQQQQHHAQPPQQSATPHSQQQGTPQQQQQNQRPPGDAGHAAQQQMTPSQQLQAQHAAAVAAAAAAQMPPTSVPSLAWPIFQPTVSIPFFDMATYQKVNLDVQPSSMPNGMDLPLNDINTLRFFFNFGVQHARAILLRQHLQSQNAGGHQPPLAAASLALLGQSDPLLVQQQLLKAQAELAAGKPPSLSQAGVNVPHSGAGGGGLTGAGAFQRQAAGGPGEVPTAMSINSLAQHMAKIGALPQHAASLFKPGGGEQVETLLLQNALLNNVAGGAAAQLKNLYANAGNIPAFATPAVQALLQQQQQLAAAHAAASQANPTVTEQTAEMLRHHGLAHLAAAQPLSASVTPTPGSGHQGQQNSQSNSQSPKNPRIPVDPAPPRKSSAAPMHSQSLQDQLDEIRRRGLNAIGSPTSGGNGGTTTSVSDSLQRSIAAFRSSLENNAVAASQALAVSQASSVASPRPPSSQQHQHHHLQSPPSTSAAQQMQQQQAGAMPSLAAQLSAAMVSSGFLEMFNQQHQQQHQAQQQAAAAASQANSGGGPLGGFPVSNAQSGRSLTTGSSGVHNPISAATGNVELPPLKAPFLQGIIPPELEVAPSLLAASELHYSETFKKSQGLFQGGQSGNKKVPSPRPQGAPSTTEAQKRKSGVYMLNTMDSKDEPPKGLPNEKKPSNEKPPMVPSMINHVNSYLTQAKTLLQSHGLGLNFDQQGRPIDFSSRPIDPIFKKAREQLEMTRDYKTLAESPTVSASGSPPEGTSGDAANRSCLIGIKTEQHPQSVYHRSAASTSTEPGTSEHPSGGNEGAENRSPERGEEGVPASANPSGGTSTDEGDGSGGSGGKSPQSAEAARTAASGSEAGAATGDDRKRESDSDSEYPGEKRLRIASASDDD